MADENTETGRVKDSIATAAQMIENLGVSVKTFDQLAREGVMLRVSPGKYLVWTSVRNYLGKLRNAGTGRGGATATARASLLTAQARIAEIKEATLRGDRVQKDDVIAEWSNTIRQIRARMLALPSRLGGRLPHLTPTDRAEIDAEIREILTELGDYNSFTDDGYVPVDLRPAAAPTTEPVDRDDDQAA